MAQHLGVALRPQRRGVSLGARARPDDVGKECLGGRPVDQSGTGEIAVDTGAQYDPAGYATSDHLFGASAGLGPAITLTVAVSYGIAAATLLATLSIVRRRRLLREC